MFKQKSGGAGFSVKVWRGDAKTLLAFNFTNETPVTNLAGFSICVKPGTKNDYYLLNNLTLAPGNHAKVNQEPANSTANAPIQKFRWLHVPGQFHQDEGVFYGDYTYTITPRYFDAAGLLMAIDATLSVSVDITVAPYATDEVKLGFTRGFVQSQAFTHHFGKDADFRPAGKQLLFDTTAKAGENGSGQAYTFQDEYEWSGFTARDRIFELIKEVVDDPALSMDVFAYDLNEPDVCAAFIKLAAQGRIRMILDNAALHHPDKPEDDFTDQFNAARTGNAAIMRGKFGRYAHHKVFIVYKNDAAGKPQPLKVLTGSTNFSVTGMYVNSNHVLVFNNAAIAGTYANVFATAWKDKVSVNFNQSPLAEIASEFETSDAEPLSINFSPHPADIAENVLGEVANRVKAATSSVLFAVMDMASGGGPVFPALADLHQNQNVFSYGISDAPGAGTYLYKPGNKTGVLVGGKPGTTELPPPFDKERSISFGHQIHHKFIICDFNTDHAVVFCGSSNLALGGEKANGDNLIRIANPDVATVFAIEAIGLVDHFDFRNAHAAPKKDTAKAAIKGEDNTAASKKAAAHPQSHTLNLYNNDSWAKRYFDPNDLHCTDRVLFGYSM